MLHISPSLTYFVCVQLVDFRKGIDGLAAVCRNILDQDPFHLWDQNRERQEPREVDGTSTGCCLKSN